MQKRWIVRWWPLLYSFAWIIWAVLAPEPHIADMSYIGHAGAGLGAIGLLVMAFWPGKVAVRFFGTLLAVVYPLYRALSLAANPEAIPDTGRRIVAICFSLVVILSLLVMYPTLWWVAKSKDIEDER